MKRFLQTCLLSIAVMLTIGSAVAQPVSAAASATVKEAQTILAKFGMPVGSVDGLWGAQTARGLCAFRVIAGGTASRSGITTTTMQTLRAYNKKYSKLQSIPAPSRSARTTYMYVNQTCQVMLYVKSAKYQKAIAVSTGKATTKETTTPNGTFTMDKTSRGWSCSTQYPETCKTQTAGRFANLVTSGSKRTNFGNMYNKRHVVNGVYVHGSMNVPTYPGSAGCIRITPADSDWMYDNVNAMPIIITGKY